MPAILALMSKKHIKFLKTIGTLVIISVITTFASYGVVTGRNLRLDPLEPYVIITGESIINLPCAGGPDDYGAYTDWVSSDPFLPEARGLPFNYHFWNPCSHDQILRTGFLLDLTFWFLLYASTYALYLGYTSHRGTTHKKRTAKPRTSRI
jgi:hypothetical protein